MQLSPRNERVRSCTKRKRTDEDDHDEEQEKEDESDDLDTECNDDDGLNDEVPETPARSRTPCKR